MDDKTFDIYAEGLTSTINQADSDFATGVVKTYKPKSVSEMSAFVAIIRPGCASLLQDFIERKPYTTGVQELDSLLVEGENRMIYQELIMKYLIWLGIKEAGSYDIIKKIAKKKFKEEELAALKSELLQGWIEKVERENGFIETWTVVEQAAKYSFNASHSLSYAYDSLYGAYLKSHYPLEYYTVALNYYDEDSERTSRLTSELSSFDIQLKPIRFRYSRSDYSLSREDHSIYKGIHSIKYMNAKVADEMYELRQNCYTSFSDLLYDLKEKTSINNRQLEILIKLDFFSEFGDSNSLFHQSEIFDLLYGKSQVKKQNIEKIGLSCVDLAKFSGRETEKMFYEIDMRQFLSECLSKLKYRSSTLNEKVVSQIEYLGYVDICSEQYKGLAAVIEVDTKYSPRLKLHSLRNGKVVDCKVDKKTFNLEKISSGDVIRVQGQTKKPKMKKSDNGKFEVIPGSSELWITKYSKCLIS